MKRLAVARLWHEGDSFCPDATTLDDFRQREWVAGEDALAHYRGTATEMGAVVDFLDGNEDRCAALAEVDAPGPACLDLGQLRFRHAPGLARAGA